jgi:hypothetical protein
MPCSFPGIIKCSEILCRGEMAAHVADYRYHYALLEKQAELLGKQAELLETQVRDGGRQAKRSMEFENAVRKSQRRDSRLKGQFLTEVFDFEITMPQPEIRRHISNECQEFIMCSQVCSTADNEYMILARISEREKALCGLSVYLKMSDVVRDISVNIRGNDDAKDYTCHTAVCNNGDTDCRSRFGINLSGVPPLEQIVDGDLKIKFTVTITWKYSTSQARKANEGWDQAVKSGEEPRGLVLVSELMFISEGRYRRGYYHCPRELDEQAGASSFCVRKW